MPGLNIDMTTPIEEGLSKYEIQDVVAATLAQKGFVPPKNPGPINDQEFAGQLPNNLTELSDNALGDLLGTLSEFQNFAQYQLAEAQMNYVKADKELEFVAAHLRMIYKYDENGKKRTEQERKDVIMLDRRYVDAQHRLLFYESLYRIIRAIANSAEQNFSAISRRITQRGQDLERDRRQQNTGYIPAPVFRRSGT